MCLLPFVFSPAPTIQLMNAGHFLLKPPDNSECRLCPHPLRSEVEARRRSLCLTGPSTWNIIKSALPSLVTGWESSNHKCLNFHINVNQTPFNLCCGWGNERVSSSLIHFNKRRGSLQYFIRLEVGDRRQQQTGEAVSSLSSFITGHPLALFSNNL